MSIIDTNQYPFLFSVGTQIAYSINNLYYGGVHYVWCTTSISDPSQPPTSNPMTIAKRWLSIVATGDKHADEVNQNISGVLTGAQAKRIHHIINENEEEDIRHKVADPPFKDFMPVLYIINTEKVKNRCKEVDPAQKASESSVEYLIEDLQNGEFEVFDIGNLVSEIRKYSDRRVSQK